MTQAIAPESLAELIALVAALPDEQFLEVAGPRLQHERLSEGHWMADWVDKAKAAHEAALTRATVAKQRAEGLERVLATEREFVRQQGFVVSTAERLVAAFRKDGRISHSALTKELGDDVDRFREHWAKRLAGDLVAAGEVETEALKATPEAPTAKCEACGGDGRYAVENSDGSRIRPWPCPKCMGFGRSSSGTPDFMAECQELFRQLAMFQRVHDGQSMNEAGVAALRKMFVAGQKSNESRSQSGRATEGKE